MSVSESLERLASWVKEEGVAPRVALGFACLRGETWDISTGGDQDLVFDLASLTKPVTAVACLRAGLREERLGDLVVETRGSPVERAPLELALAHRIGLDAHVPLFLRDLAEPRAALEIVARSVRPECTGPLPPGGFPPLYSDLGYILAGIALARHVGAVDAGAAISELVVEPLRLLPVLGTARDFQKRLGEHHLGMIAPTEHVPFRGGPVHGVVHDENAWVLTGEGASGHAGLFGTVSAVLAFGTHVHDQRERYDWLIRERSGGTLRAGFDGKSKEGSSAGARIGPRAFGHLGFTGTSVWIDPDAHVVVALLTNRVNPSRENQRIKEARPKIHDALFELATS